MKIQNLMKRNFNSFNSFNSIRTRTYRTERSYVEGLLNRVFSCIDKTWVQDPHKYLIIASHVFNEPKPCIDDTMIHALCIMDLLNQFGYPSITSYTKFGIIITMEKIKGVEFTFSIGTAIPLTDDSSHLLPKKWVYCQIYKQLKKYAEIY